MMDGRLFNLHLQDMVLRTVKVMLVSRKQIPVILPRRRRPDPNPMEPLDMLLSGLHTAHTLHSKRLAPTFSLRHRLKQKVLLPTDLTNNLLPVKRRFKGLHSHMLRSNLSLRHNLNKGSKTFTELLRLQHRRRLSRMAIKNRLQHPKLSNSLQLRVNYSLKLKLRPRRLQLCRGRRMCLIRTRRILIRMHKRGSSITRRAEMILQERSTLFLSLV